MKRGAPFSVDCTLAIVLLTAAWTLCATCGVRGEEFDRHWLWQQPSRLRDWQTAGGTPAPHAWRPCADGRCGAEQAPAPAVRAKSRPAIVQVRFTPQGATETRHATGTIVAANETEALVLTCAHTFLPENGHQRNQSDRPLAGRASVVTSRSGRTAGGDELPARLIRSDTVLDLAALEIPRPAGDLRAAPIAAAYARQGEKLWAFGYAGSPNGRPAVADSQPSALSSQPALHVVAGATKGYLSTTAGGKNELLVVAGRTVGGFSGGPLLNAAGELAGTIVGSNADGIVGPYSGALRAFVADLVEAEGQEPRAKSEEPSAPHPVPPSALSPPLSAPPPSAEIRADALQSPAEAEEEAPIATIDLAAIEALLDAKLAGLQGAKGDRGEQGPPGPSGPPGEARSAGGAIDPAELLPLFDAYLKAHPLTVRTLDADNRVLEEFKINPLGGALNLRLDPRAATTAERQRQRREK